MILRSIMYNELIYWNTSTIEQCLVPESWGCIRGRMDLRIVKWKDIHIHARMDVRHSWEGWISGFVGLLQQCNSKDIFSSFFAKQGFIYLFLTSLRNKDLWAATARPEKKTGFRRIVHARWAGGPFNM